MAPRGDDVSGLDPMTEPANVVGKPDQSAHRVACRVAADALHDTLAVDLERHHRLLKVARTPFGRSRPKAEAAVASDIREFRKSQRGLPGLKARLDQLDRW